MKIVVTFNEAFRSSSLLLPAVAGTTLAALSLASKVMTQAATMRKPGKEINIIYSFLFLVV